MFEARCCYMQLKWSLVWDVARRVILAMQNIVEKFSILLNATSEIGTTSGLRYCSSPYLALALASRAFRFSLLSTTSWRAAASSLSTSW